MSLNIPKTEEDTLRRVANERGLSMSAVIRQAIRLLCQIHKFQKEGSRVEVTRVDGSKAEILLI